MLRRLVLIVAIWGMGVVGASGQEAESTEKPAPQFTLSQDSWEFGEVWHGEDPELRLVVTNKGTADLELKRVSSTCGCTIPRVRANLLPPRKSTAIFVAFDTKGKQGPVESKLLFETNDPQRPRVEFPINGSVKRAATLSPAGGLAIRTLGDGTDTELRVRLENRVSEPMRPRIKAKSIASLDVRLEEVTPEVAYDIVARLTKPLEPGIILGTIQIETGLPREPLYDVPVRLHRLALVEPAPPVIWLNPERATQPQDMWLSLNYYGGMDPFELQRATCAHAGVGVVLSPVRQGDPSTAEGNPPVLATAQIQVRVPAAADLPPGGTEIVIHTNDPKIASFKVPVTTDRELLDRRLKGPPEAPLVEVRP